MKKPQKYNVGVGLAPTPRLAPTHKFVNFRLLVCCWFILFVLFSCRRYPKEQLQQNTAEIERMKREIVLQVNRELIEEEAQTIKNYVESRNWDMKTTETGLWYMINDAGKGEKAEAGKRVTIDYTLSLMDSTICYSSEIYGQKIFVVGYSDVESGLNEGIQLMRVGDKARMIMPPHLAHGLLGDGDCIPRRAIIIYDVEVLVISD